MHSRVLRNVWKSFLCDGDRANCRFYSFDNVPKTFESNNRAKMPKPKEKLQAMQLQREKMKKKTGGYSPSKVTLQILGSGARGAPRSLYVSTDHTKYMFNCSEGTQRLSHEHRLRLSKMENIFVTTPTWSNIGGLPGMALTVQENGVPHIRVHGPKGCIDIFTAIRRFVSLKDLTVSEAACKEDEPYVDSVMSIRYVTLSKPAPETQSDGEDESIPVDNVDYYAYEVNKNGKRSSSQERNFRKRPRTEDLINGGRITGSMAYICKLQPKPGMLLLDKCVDKGIKPGPLLGKLKAGEDVTLPDGTIVLSSEVCSPEDPGPVFIVLECPHEDYLDSLLSSDAFAKHQRNGEDPANCVVHFTPERVLQNPRYREWMEKFATTTRHMLINEENDCMGSEAIHRLQHKLHLLHPTIFPFVSEEGIAVDKSPVNSVEPQIHKSEIDDLPVNSEDSRIKLVSPHPEKKTDENSSQKDDLLRSELLISRVKTLDAFHLRPYNGFDTSEELVLTPRAYVDEVFGVDGFLDALAELQTEMNAKTKSLGDSAEFPKIVMLGTGSCIPNKTRNTSGILLRIDEDNSVIMDCGEGTASQITRFYGKKEADKIFASIKVIYVSHLHADHHIGLIGLLQERDRVTKEPVKLLAPEQIGSWLRIYNRRFESISSKFELFPNKDLNLTKRDLSVAEELRLQKTIEGVRFSTAWVKHCFYSFGVSITLANGYKIVYSGDTMPCDALVELGENCDLLIHEATMEDDLEDEARMKCHSTISQAINIGERMKAKFILLTHFSQRYSKLPHLPRDARTPNLSNVGIAYDNMQVSVSQLALLPLLYPALNVMFTEFRSLLEEKAMKRQMRLEKEARAKHNEEFRERLP